MEINERIFYLLNQQSKKASALAKYLGIKPSSITGWKNEGSYPSSKYIQKISEFLNVSIEYLITGTDNMISINTINAPDQQELLSLYSQLDERGKGEVIGFIKAKLS